MKESLKSLPHVHPRQLDPRGSGLAGNLRGAGQAGHPFGRFAGWRSPRGGSAARDARKGPVSPRYGGIVQIGWVDSDVKGAVVILIMAAFFDDLSRGQ